MRQILICLALSLLLLPFFPFQYQAIWIPGERATKQIEQYLKDNVSYRLELRLNGKVRSFTSSQLSNPRRALELIKESKIFEFNQNDPKKLNLLVLLVNQDKYQANFQEVNLPLQMLLTILSQEGLL